MNILLKYEDYVNYLSHKNSLVRRWAFDALERRYKNRYTDEVSKLVGDDDEHLACAAPIYLAEHNAVQHAPAILASFKNGYGDIPSNCVRALARMKYEPALEDIIGSFSTRINSGASIGIFEYLGSVYNENTRDTLISAAIQIKDSFLQGCAAYNLLRHNNPEDMKLILKIILESAKQKKSIGASKISTIMDFWGAKGYFNNLTICSGGKDIIKNPKESLQNFFQTKSHIAVKTEQFDMLVKNIEKGQYPDLVTTLMFEVQTIVQHRYPETSSFEESQELFAQDKMAVTLFIELSKQPSIWKELEKNKNSGIERLLALVIAVYFSVLERDIYLKALLPNAKLGDLIAAVKNSGARLPEKIYKKIVELSPVPELKNALSERFNAWANIWIVRIMGEIGSKEFVPDLINVLNFCDSLDYIYSDAIRSMTALDESADKTILTAIQNKSLEDWESASILELLPYAESFDLICKIWEDNNSEMDSHETFAYCLKGIGDKRGIKKLQEMYAQDKTSDYVGDVLECLSILHDINIPELPEIRIKREKNKKEQVIKSEEFNEFLNDSELLKDIDNIKNKDNVIPFKRKIPKVGKNDQ
jgi:hypothetical protein